MIKVKRTDMVRGWLWAAFPVLLVACGEIGGSGQCGGVDDSGACVVIESILPTYEVFGGDTSNVDAFMDFCEAEFEAITDHGANITISNKPFPGSSVDTVPPDVTLTQYTIEYSPNFCPNGICPDLLPVRVSESVFVPGGGAITRQLKMVDLSKKMEYAAGVGDDLFPSDVGAPHTPNANLYPSYTARYTFTGKDIFNNDVAASGVTEFTIGDYNNCE